MSTEIFSHLNWLAVAVAGLAYFLLGAIWYSFLFRNAWIRFTGVKVDDPDAKKGVAGIMGASLVLMILCSLGLAILTYKTGVTTWMGGVKLGLVTGICFSVTGISISYLYEKRPMGLHFINGGYNVVGSVLASIILSVWQ